MLIHKENAKNILILVLLLVVGFYVYTNQHSSRGTVFQDESYNKNSVEVDRVVQVKLKSINFWEAQFEVLYEHNRQRQRGYLTTVMDSWTPNVGINTHAGKGSGISYLNRVFGSTDSHGVSSIKARMYDPYRSDYSFFEGVFPVDIEWPGVDSLTLPDEDTQGFNSISEVVLYRNIPDYIGFAEKLVLEGFYPERIGMNLAPCVGCQGSLIFGDGVSVEALQSVLRVMKGHPFHVDHIYHSNKDDDIGKIIIGNTPPQESQPFWANIDQLLAAELSEKMFFELVNLPLATKQERLWAYEQKARRYIDSDRRKLIKKSRKLIDAGLELDPTFIPLHIQLARYLMRTNRFSEYGRSEGGDKALRVLSNAIKLDPKFAESYVLLARVQRAMQDFEASQASLDKAAELGSKSNWWIVNQARLYQEQDKLGLATLEFEKLFVYKTSVEVFEKSMYLSADDRAYLFGLRDLGKLYIGNKDNEKAVKTFSNLAKIFPHKIWVQRPYIYMLIATGQYTDIASSYVQKYKKANCDCAYTMSSMQKTIDAADQIEQIASEETLAHASRLLISAQNSDVNYGVVISELLRGERGRKVVETLLDNQLLNVKELESMGAPLIQAAYSGYADSVAFLLKQGGNPNYLMSDDGYSALMYAVYAENMDMIESMMLYGGDPQKQNSYGVSALGIATEEGNSKILELLSSQPL